MTREIVPNARDTYVGEDGPQFLEDMTREELIAVIKHLKQDLQEARERTIKRRDLLSSESNGQATFPNYVRT
jgi:hypothetical protein